MSHSKEYLATMRQEIIDSLQSLVEIANLIKTLPIAERHAIEFNRLISEMYAQEKTNVVWLKIEAAKWVKENDHG